MAPWNGPNQPFLLHSYAHNSQNCRALNHVKSRHTRHQQTKKTL